MSLYLCVFDEDGNDLDGVDCGLYADFGAFRDAVHRHLETGEWGCRFPTLMLHSDCEGVWSPDELSLLLDELKEIDSSFKRLPVQDFNSDWQEDLAKRMGWKPRNLAECFIDVDCEPLLERLLSICKFGIKRGLPVEFQ